MRLKLFSMILVLVLMIVGLVLWWMDWESFCLLCFGLKLGVVVNLVVVWNCFLCLYGVVWGRNC